MAFKETDVIQRISLVRANHVRFNPFGGLVGHFDAILQDQLWELWTWVASEEETEGMVNWFVRLAELDFIEEVV